MVEIHRKLPIIPEKNYGLCPDFNKYGRVTYVILLVDENAYKLNGIVNLYKVNTTGTYLPINMLICMI